VTIYLVRHAHAGDRSAWDGRDSARPLSRRGRNQADAIAARYADRPIARVLSSPAVRCKQTVAPIAHAQGIKVEVSAPLREGTPTDEAIELLRSLARTEVVLCSHGDVIPAVMRSLRDAGLEIHGGRTTSKASVFEITTRHGKFASARYIAPPRG
jgi:8-oxo-dGTP diphosphatase